MLLSSLLPAELTDVWTFILLGSVSAMLVSVAKAGFGGSLGLLSVPIMIYACGGKAMLAAGVTLPLLIACDYFSIISWWGKWELRVVWLLLPGAVLGVGMGWAALYAIRQLGVSAESDTANAALTLGIGVISVGFVVLQAILAFRSRALIFRPVLWQATGIGAVAGLTSTLAHAAGPIVTMYMLPQGLPKGKFVATTVLYYWIGNQIKLVPYLALGLIDFGSMRASLVLMPAVVFGVALGILLHRLCGQRQFTGVIHVLLALAGMHLIVKACNVLWAF